jgi:hypothetical protein
MRAALQPRVLREPRRPDRRRDQASPARDRPQGIVPFACCRGQRLRPDPRRSRFQGTGSGQRSRASYGVVAFRGHSRTLAHPSVLSLLARTVVGMVALRPNGRERREAERPDFQGEPNGRERARTPPSTSWGSLVRAQHRPPTETPQKRGSLCRRRETRGGADEDGRQSGSSSSARRSRPMNEPASHYWPSGSLCSSSARSVVSGGQPARLRLPSPS